MSKQVKPSLLILIGILMYIVGVALQGDTNTSSTDTIEAIGAFMVVGSLIIFVAGLGNWIVTRVRGSKVNSSDRNDNPDALK